jgi:hypothetical protein
LHNLCYPHFHGRLIDGHRDRWAAEPPVHEPVSGLHAQSMGELSVAQDTYPKLNDFRREASALLSPS